jgi:hypothetical protein
MPFPDVGSSVAGVTEGARDGVAAGVEFDVIDIDAMRQWILSGHQAGAIGAAHRTSGHGVCYINAARSQVI